MTIRMYRGDTRVIVGTAKQSGTAMNITGGTIVMTARYGIGETAVFTHDNAGNGGIVLTSPTSGIFTITIAPASTSSLPDEEMQLQYDIQYTTSGSAVYTLARGTLLVTPDITT